MEQSRKSLSLSKLNSNFERGRPFGRPLFLCEAQHLLNFALQNNCMTPSEYYTKRRNEAQNNLDRLRRLGFILSMLRLSVFIVVATVWYFAWGSTAVIFTSTIVGAGIFLFLVARYTDTKLNQRYFQQLVAINSAELNALNGDYSEFSEGTEFIFEEHHYNQDIDLFGKGSLFQLINRTETVNGRKRLAAWLNANTIENIQAKQEGLKELATLSDWRQHYKASASLIETNVPSSSVINWVSQYKAFVPRIHRFVPIIFSAISLTAFALYAIGIIPSSYLLYLLLIGLGITGPYVKRITRLFNVASQMKETFAQYAKLLEAIENQALTSPLLKTERKKIETDGVKASQLLKNLSRHIDYLANRNNMIFAPIANGFFLWDLYFTQKIEHWLGNFDESVVQWFDTIEFFDAVNSMANYAFNHPDYIYPSIAESENVIMNAQQLGHPLLNSRKVVRNSIDIRKEDFFIITGANMAGKSTFLRTVALNLVMANCGLPVSAEKFSYHPIKLISSMRTSDSLQNDESYFFSELKRLKFIVDEMQKDAYFIILDEILKGTNSKDKAEGSRKFVEKLVASNSTGLIATHDLSLCVLSDQLPQIQNHYFDAEIVDDELYFDYTFKEGICQNMNASFLLKKMGIVNS